MELKFDDRCEEISYYRDTKRISTLLRDYIITNEKFKTMRSTMLIILGDPVWFRGAVIMFLAGGVADREADISGDIQNIQLPILVLAVDSLLLLHGGFNGFIPIVSTSASRL